LKEVDTATIMSINKLF